MPNIFRSRSAAGLLLLLLAPLSHAQLYKWVDAQGRVHYSDSKEEAGRARVKELQPAQPPLGTPDDGEDWRKREEDYQRRHQAQARAEPPKQARPAPKGYYTNDPDTNASKCRLARDIVSGKARPVSGRSVDAYDREIANNDIKSFCR